MSLTNLMYKEIHFDSDEEVFVAMWLEELKQKGVVLKWEKCKTALPLTFGLKFKYAEKMQLKTKIKTVEKNRILLTPSEYTPDFLVIFGPFKKPLLSPIYEINKPHALFYTNDFPSTYLEIKPEFDQNNMERIFKMNQKFLWNNYQIFVNLVKPNDLFKKTFLPLEAVPYFKYKKAPTGRNKGKKGPGDWKMDWPVRTINEFLKF